MRTLAWLLVAVMSLMTTTTTTSSSSYFSSTTCAWRRAGDQDDCDLRQRQDYELLLRASPTTATHPTYGSAYETQRNLLGNPVYFVNPATVPRGPSAGSDFGWIIATNGNTMLVGADQYQNGTVQNAGMVRIFQCEGTTCLLQSTIKNPQNVPGYFGQAIASVGNYAAFGAPGLANQGFVFIYDISNILQPKKLNTVGTPSGGTTVSTQFGSGVALYELSASPAYLIMAAGDETYPYNSAPNTGLLYFFKVTKSTGAAVRLAAFSDYDLYNQYADTSARSFGYPVIQSDNWVATSAQGLQNVYVYSCTGLTGNTCGRVGNVITNPDANGADIGFGYMLSLQKSSSIGGDGSTLVAGALKEASYRGSAYVYRYNVTSPTPWTLMQTLLPAAQDGSAPMFGSGVALSAGTLVVSAYQGNAARGSLYIYYCSNGVCSDIIQIINCQDTYTNGKQDTNTCQSSNFGNNALALSGTATFLAVGARYAYGTVQQQPGGTASNVGGTGAVFIYSTAPTAIPTATPTQPTPQPTPTPGPSAQPTVRPSAQPTVLPTVAPSVLPTVRPTAVPSVSPSVRPSAEPSVCPTVVPTAQPTSRPSVPPTVPPTRLPSAEPTPLPTAQPTTPIPTNIPTAMPSAVPSVQPTVLPSAQPTVRPTVLPTQGPTPSPSPAPSTPPTQGPTQPPTTLPSSLPTPLPSSVPTNGPTFPPTCLPSAAPTVRPTVLPSANPSVIPSAVPSPLPSALPSTLPSALPTPRPSSIPTPRPSSLPTALSTPRPSACPTRRPTFGPSGLPSGQPTGQPSQQPTGQPTLQPNASPTNQPTGQPSGQPTHQAVLLHQQAQQTFLDSVVYGANKTWFYLALGLLVLLMCACFWAWRWWCRRSSDGGGGKDKRTPYEIWTDYHDAKASGGLKDYVPPAKVANPLPPQQELELDVEGAGDGGNVVAPVAKIFRRMSTRIMGGGGGGAAGGESGISVEMQSVGGRSNVFDASGSANANVRISDMNMDDLYGSSGGGGGGRVPFSSAPTERIRNLDRLDDDANPANLSGVENDPVVTAATAMAVAAKQISASKKKSAGVFAAYNPLIVGMQKAKDEPAAAAAAAVTAVPTTMMTTTTTTQSETYNPRVISMAIRPNSTAVLLGNNRRGSTNVGVGAGGMGVSVKRLQLSQPLPTNAQQQQVETSYPIGTPLQSPESLEMAARLSTIQGGRGEEEEEESP